MVTGAAGGIGQAIVEILSDAGAAIAAADIQLEGIKCAAALPGDLADPTYCDGLPAQAQRILGGLDIVVNNAGIIRRGPLTDATEITGNRLPSMSRHLFGSAARLFPFSLKVVQLLSSISPPAGGCVPVPIIRSTVCPKPHWQR